VVVTVKVVDVAPAATVTELGTVALVLLDERLTDIPPVGATPVRVTVPVDEVPPVTEVGLSETPLRVGGLMVRVADWLTPLKLPCIVAVVWEATAVVVTVKVAVVAPAATETLAGTVALVLLEERLTVIPLGPAAAERVTVPVEGLPPITLVGESETLDSAAGLIVKVAV
jgi:hypothetical protein